MMTVNERLNSKKEELEERLAGQYHGGSQRREALQYKIKKIEELIEIYQLPPPSSLNLSEAEEVLDQQIGFEEQKRVILESLETEEIERFREQHNIPPKPPLILCFSGPPGIGKTSFAKVLAQALKREFFSISLTGLSDTSILSGTSENSSGTEIGRLTKALIETKTPNPVILLDEIDKSGSLFRNVIHDYLVSILDPTQNQEIIDHYLDVKLDFSQVVFITTANDLQKISQPLLDRMQIFELPGYTVEQKKEIAQRIIQSQFSSNEELRDKLKITSEALEILIGKIHEEGVRQLKRALESKVFSYCLQK
jgi:ATP-dependent Lon protease